MTMLRLLGLSALVALAVAGCARKAESVKIDGLTLYKDDVRQFEIKLPNGWHKQSLPGQLVVVHSTPTIGSRFLNFSKGEGGCKIELRVIPVDSALTLDTLVKNSKLQFEDGLDRYIKSSATLGGKPAQKLTVEFDQEDGKYKSESYFAEQDSVVTVVTFAAFGNTYGDYEDDFKEILASVKIARRQVEQKPKVDTAAPKGPEPPSDTLRSYNAPDFAIEIPQNFNGSKAQSSGLSSVSFAGSRLDCTIQVDVFDASKQSNLDKIIEQNKAKYGGGSATGTTLGGAKAYYFSYNPAANIGSRAYFTVKGNKMYRVTVNWYKPEQNVYLPLFERCIASVKLK